MQTRYIDPDYWVQLWFDQTGTLVAFVNKDDYTTYADIEGGVQGSELSDLNLSTNLDEAQEALRNLLGDKDMLDYVDTIQTNNSGATLALLRNLDILHEYKTMPIPRDHTLEGVKRRAQELYDADKDYQAYLMRGCHG